MFTAKEAYKKAQEVRDNYQRDLKELENRIEAAVFRGEFGIVVDNYLSDLVIEKLYEFGYKVTLNNEQTTREEIVICGKVCPLLLNKNDSPYYTIEWS